MSAPSIRINRYLASCGLGSRRSCEDLIREGRVTVNGTPCAGLSTRVSPTDDVAVDGRAVAPAEEVTILLHKPPGYLCTRNDTEDRPTIYHLLPAHLGSLHHVGRLDKESEGLLLLTNSGDLTARLTHPRHKIEKEYFVTLARPLAPGSEKQLLDGISTREGFARAKAVHALGRRKLMITLDQGIKRQIRLMFEALGNKVKTLSRIRIGNLTDSTLAPGKWRILGKRDLTALLSDAPNASAKVIVEPEKKA